MTRTVAEIAAALELRCPTRHRLPLAFGDLKLEVRSNAAELLDGLRCYFAAFDSSGDRHSGGAASAPDLVIRVHAMDPPELDLPYREWSREPGKQAQKEAFVDLPDGRAVLKVRTGMQFLVGRALRVAFGDAAAQPNQVVNFIDFQLTA